MLQSLYRYLKTTLLGGILVVLPLVGCAYLIGLTLKIVLGVIMPINRLLPIPDLAGIAVIDLLAISIIVVTCFLLGLLVRTAGGRTLGRWFEQSLLYQLPGYRLLRRLSRQVAGETEEALGAPVLVRLGDSRQYGFLVEELPTGEVTVFVPLAPLLYLGTVHLVPAERVTRLSQPLPRVIDRISRFGIGSANIAAAARQTASVPVRSAGGDLVPRRDS